MSSCQRSAILQLCIQTFQSSLQGPLGLAVRSDLIPGMQLRCPLSTPRAPSHSESLGGRLNGINKVNGVSWLENLIRNERQDKM